MRSFLTLMAVAVLGGLLTAGPVAADLTNVRPVSPLGPSWDPAPADLQDLLNGDIGYPATYGWGSSGLDAVADQSPYAIFNPGVDLLADSTLLLEISGHGSTNTFGIYEYGNPTNRLTVFDGGDSQGDKASITFDYLGTFGHLRAVNLTTLVTHEATFSQINFGFWLEDPTTGNIFYSEDSLNNGGYAQALIFDGNDATNPSWGMDGDWIVAFEDLPVWLSPNGCDADYNDFVVFASDIDPAVPEASTLMLFGSGLSGILFYVRKKGLIKL